MAVSPSNCCASYHWSSQISSHWQSLGSGRSAAAVGTQSMIYRVNMLAMHVDARREVLVAPCVLLAVLFPECIYSPCGSALEHHSQRAGLHAAAVACKLECGMHSYMRLRSLWAKGQTHAWATAGVAAVTAVVPLHAWLRTAGATVSSLVCHDAPCSTDFDRKASSAASRSSCACVFVDTSSPTAQ
eukprot:352252-Chlamydomonas_euryale.AAC.5